VGQAVLPNAHASAEQPCELAKSCHTFRLG